MKKIFTIFAIVSVLILEFTISNSFAQLTGTKTVGTTGCDYATISAAITALNAQGVGTGGVIFSLIDETYSETPMTINEITGASSSNTITFKPSPSITPTITITANSSDKYGFRLNGADYITFDGSNSSDGRDMKILIDGVEGRGFFLENASSNNTIKNCEIEGFSIDDVLSRGISVEGGDNDNNTFENNRIYKFYKGIHLDGNENDYATGNAIKDNEIGTSLRKCGVYCRYQTNLEISGNEISIIYTSDIFGIMLYYSHDATISKNIIHDIVCTGSNGHGFGIYLELNDNPLNVTIVNNFIYHIAGRGRNPPWNAPSGIYISFTTPGD